MTPSIALGTGAAVDLEKLVESRMLIQAQSGAGKTTALRRLLEQSHGRIQHLILDPEGEFSTLRERFDYVLAARHHGDTVADPRSAKLLAERLLELGVSAILDLYELKAHERIRFVRLFLEALIEAPRALRHPVLVVIDEAHVFCPEKGQAESAPAVVDLCARGRKRGLCAILATQRLSKLHKDAAAELRNVLIGATGLDIDQQRAGDVLGFTKADRLKLRDLKWRQFYAYGPALSPGVKLIMTGETLTRNPPAGRALAPPPPPTAKVKALLPKLADLPAEAEERAKTLGELTRELQATRHALTLAKRGVPTAAPKERLVEKRVEVPILKDGHLARLERVAERFGKASGQLLLVGGEIVTALSRLNGTRTTTPTPATWIPTTDPRVDRTRRTPAPKPTPPARRGRAEVVIHDGESAEPITGPEQRILDAIAWLESIGNAEPELAAAAFLAGYKLGGGAFNNPRGKLHNRGLVEYLQGGRIRLTDAGRALARAPETPLTTAELHRRVLARLPGPEQRILQPLLDAYPETLAHAELAEAAGYRDGGGAFNNPRGRLRSLGLIDYPTQGRAVARPLLFLEGT